jgi:hypothetical protein
MNAQDSEAKYNNVGDAAVQSATGKGWMAWFAILDGAGASSWPHPKIAAYLHDEQGVADWWSQTVTVGYEQARGLRAKHEKTDGFTANGSRTLNVPVDVLYAAWAEPARRAQWLPDAPIVVNKATPGKSLRLLWAEDDTRVDVNLYAKGAQKSQVAIQHSKLPDAATAEAMKAYWRAALDRLATHLADAGA